MAVFPDTQELSGPVVTGFKKRSNLDGNLSDSATSTTSGSSSSSSYAPAPAAATTGRRRRRTRRRNRKKSKTNTTADRRPHIIDISPQEQAKYVAMDCEMVGVGKNGYKSALARVTMIDWNGNILLDTFVKPDRPVTDYRTNVSGITAQDLDDENGAAETIESVRWQVQQLLHNKVLIGHALKNDLAALGGGLCHPWQQTRDTAKYEPFMKVRCARNDGILWPRKLKDLVAEKLHCVIQQPGTPHSPYEDAKAALDLYKLVRVKWEKVMDYKIQRTREILEQQQQQQDHQAAQ